MTKKITVKNLTGWEWRRVTRGSREVLQRRRKVQVFGLYDTFTLADMKKVVAEHKFKEPEFEIEQDYEYGDQVVRIYLRGWSDATKEEIDAEIAKLQEHQDFIDQREQDEIERLRKKRPDLFKEVN